MFDKRQYLINTITNYIVYFSNIVVALALSPFVVGTLGDAYYGIWTIIVAFTGYYGYLDFGIRQGVSQYISRHLSSREYEKFNVTVNAALLMLLAIGGVVLAVAGICAVFSGKLLQNPGAAASVPAALLILGVGIAVRFPFLVFQTIVNGMHRYDVSGLISFAVKMLYAVSVYAVLSKGMGILGLALVTTGTQLLEGFLMLLAALRLVPQIKVRLGKPDPAAVKEVMGYGIYNFISGISRQTILVVGPMVLARSLGPEMVTFYSIGANLIPYYGSLVAIVSIPLLQVIISKDVHEEKEDLKVLYLKGTRYVNLLVTYVAFVLVILGEPFLGRWMGHKYVENGACSSSLVMSILALSLMIDLSQTIGRQVLFGVRKHRFLALVSAFGALLTTCLTFPLVYLYSAVGAAIAVLVQSLLVNGVLMPFYMSRLLGVGMREFLKTSVLSNALFFIAMTSAALVLLEGRVKEDWLHIVVTLLIVSVAYLLPGTFLILGKDALFRVLFKFRPKMA